MLPGVIAGPTWRHCTHCDVAWESDEPACWSCDTPVVPRYNARPALTSQVSPVAAMRDHDCARLGLPI